MSAVNHILFIDDDGDDYQLFLETVKEINPNAVVDYVRDPSCMDESLKNPLYDLIVLDFNMPKINGIQCLQKIRANQKFNNVPVIIQSVFYDKVNEAFLNGANYFIQKQHTCNGMRNSISVIINRNWKDEKTFKDFGIFYNDK